MRRPSNRRAPSQPHQPPHRPPNRLPLQRRRLIRHRRQHRNLRPYPVQHQRQHHRQRLPRCNRRPTPLRLHRPHRWHRLPPHRRLRPSSRIPSRPHQPSRSAQSRPRQPRNQHRQPHLYLCPGQHLTRLSRLLHLTRQQHLWPPSRSLPRRICPQRPPRSCRLPSRCQRRSRRLAPSCLPSCRSSLSCPRRRSPSVRARPSRHRPLCRSRNRCPRRHQILPRRPSPFRIRRPCRCLRLCLARPRPLHRHRSPLPSRRPHLHRLRPPCRCPRLVLIRPPYRRPRQHHSLCQLRYSLPSPIRHRCLRRHLLRPPRQHQAPFPRRRLGPRSPSRYCLR